MHPGNLGQDFPVPVPWKNRTLLKSLLCTKTATDKMPPSNCSPSYSFLALNMFPSKCGGRISRCEAVKQGG